MCDCLLSKARLYDRVPLAAHRIAYRSPWAVVKAELSFDGVVAYRHLAAVFPRRQAALIESAYEQCRMGDWNKTEKSAALHGRAAALYDDVADDATRLRYVLRNVVRNGGLFDPDDTRRGLVRKKPRVARAK